MDRVIFDKSAADWGIPLQSIKLGGRDGKRRRKVGRKRRILPVGLTPSAIPCRIEPWSLVQNSAYLTRPRAGPPPPRRCFVSCYRHVGSSPKLPCHGGSARVCYVRAR